MSTAFLSDGLWPALTRAAKASGAGCWVATAYFGQGAARLLPLPKNSRLVVDASEGAVKSGQTCPADLLAMLKRGVRVFTRTHLHAKVFVFGRVAFIGSANVSRHSAFQLVEAAVRTTEPRAVRAARKFVQEHCLHELTPKVLQGLARIYRPPRLPGRPREKALSRRPSADRALPPLFLAQLHLEDWSERDQILHEAGLTVAHRRRVHPRSFELESFRCSGRCPYRRGDVVIQVTDEGAGRVLVTPPGNVLHVRTRMGRTGQVSFVYLERRAGRRRGLRSMARALGRGASKRLHRDGRVRNVAFDRALRAFWSK
jgi:hypothetical protein